MCRPRDARHQGSLVSETTKSIHNVGGFSDVVCFLLRRAGSPGGVRFQIDGLAISLHHQSLPELIRGTPICRGKLAFHASYLVGPFILVPMASPPHHTTQPPPVSSLCVRPDKGPRLRFHLLSARHPQIELEITGK